MIGIDKYELRARIFPATLAMLLVGIASFHVYSPYAKEFFQELDRWRVIFHGSLVVVIISAVFYPYKLCCQHLSKLICQNPLFGKDFTKMPTTKRLILEINKSTTLGKQLKSKVKKDFGMSLPTPSAIVKDAGKAKVEIAEAISQMREKTRGNKILLDYLIQYGFWRNLIGGLTLDLILFAILQLCHLCNVSLYWYIIDIATGLVAFFFMHLTAEEYADRLLTAYLAAESGQTTT